MTLPQVARPDAGLVLVGEWGTIDAGHQRSAADAALGAWEAVRAPAGLLSHGCLLGEDDRTLLHYIQWADEDAARAFVSTDRPQWVAAVDAAVGGIEHRRVVPYRRYRSVVPDVPPGTAGCVVTVTFETESAGQATAWVDALAGAGAAAPAGMLSAHFHVAADGSRILNYAEWVDATAHQDSVDHRPERARSSASAGQAVKVVDETPGVRFLGFARYRPYRSLSWSE